MDNPNLEDTQPIHPRKASGSSSTSSPPPKSPASPLPSPNVPEKPSQGRRGWRWTGLYALAMGIIVILGILTGYRSGAKAQVDQAVEQIKGTLQEQFELGVQDLEAGRFEVARQRFEYILSQDPAYPQAAEKLAEAMQVLYATTTPTAPPPTANPTATRDLRPVEEIFTSALEAFRKQDWDATIDTLITLRKEDRTYRTTRVDGLLFLSLRSRGVKKIINEGNLEGGIYDLSLAERFGPLDAEANVARQWARLYLYGLSFWEVYPEQAAYYFSQVAAAAPGLRDSSGWTANERYREALIQYGDQLASKQDWCNAQQQYQLALQIRADPALEEKLNTVANKCSPFTETPKLTTKTPTPTETLTSPPGWTLTPTPTQYIPPEVTPTPTATPTQPAPIPPTATPTATIEIPPTPTNTSPPPPPEPTPTTAQTYPQPAAARYSILLSLLEALRRQWQLLDLHYMQTLVRIGL